MSKARQFEVIVGGGGMVGLTLGLALARGGLPVLVADPVRPATTLAPDFDGRVSAIAYSSVRMLRTLGVWKELECHAQPINDILVTDAKLGEGPSAFSLHFDHREIGAPMGYIAENRYIRWALQKAASVCPLLHIQSPARVAALNAKTDHIDVVLDTGEQHPVPLFLAAEGRDSPSREQMGIGIVQWSYPQRGIVATVAHEHSHNGVAYEHFLPSGPFAILPMMGNRSSLVWTERETVADGVLGITDSEFDAEISRRFGAHLGTTHVAGPRWSYPLRFHLARRFATSRFALVGDAAHGIHPIAGQGLNLGFKDVAAISEVVLDAARLGVDFGTAAVLARYERWRRFDSVALAAATDGLNRLFSNNHAVLRLLRDFGMGAVDTIGPLRRFFMRHAGGDVGRLPRLLRGEQA